MNLPWHLPKGFCCPCHKIEIKGQQSWSFKCQRRRASSVWISVTFWHQKALKQVILATVSGWKQHGLVAARQLRIDQCNEFFCPENHCIDCQWGLSLGTKWGLVAYKGVTETVVVCLCCFFVLIIIRIMFSQLVSPMTTKASVDHV